MLLILTIQHLRSLETENLVFIYSQYMLLTIGKMRIDHHILLEKPIFKRSRMVYTGPKVLRYSDSNPDNAMLHDPPRALSQNPTNRGVSATGSLTVIAVPQANRMVERDRQK